MSLGWTQRTSLTYIHLIKEMPVDGLLRGRVASALFCANLRLLSFNPATAKDAGSVVGGVTHDGLARCDALLWRIKSHMEAAAF
jgi:hypothetical protein